MREGWTFPAMLMDGALPNFFTINGKSYPATPVLKMRVGEKVRFRFIGTNNNFVHPMHIHGGPFTIIETDGNPVPADARLQKDTVDVGPGERYDVIWEARQPGKWLLHCHIPHHTTNDNREEQGGGGLTMIIDVDRRRDRRHRLRDTARPARSMTNPNTLTTVRNSTAPSSPPRSLRHRARADRPRHRQQHSRPYHPKPVARSNAQLDRSGLIQHRPSPPRPRPARPGRSVRRPHQGHPTQTRHHRARRAPSPPRPHRQRRQGHLRCRPKLLHLGVGRRYRGTRVMLLVAERDVRVINDDGELLAEFTIDATKTYQTQKRPGQRA